MKRLTGGAALAGLAIAAFLWLPSLVSPSVSYARLRTSVVDTGRVEASLRASGTVLPAYEKMLTSPDAARVLRILKRPGDAVAAGDAIVELDSSATRLQLDRLTERIAQKRAERREMELGLEKELSDLTGRIQAKELDVELQRYRVRQQRELHGDGLTSETTLRQTEVELKKSEVELEQLNDSVDVARRSTAAKLERLDLDATILLKERDETRHRLELAETRADRDGVVTWVVPQEGAAITAGQEIARIADLDSFRVEATVSDAYIKRVERGMPARIKAGDTTLNGRVDVVHPSIEDGVARFDVILDDPDHDGLRSNLRVDVMVVTEVRDNVLRVARGPFARGNRDQPVFVLRDGKADRIPTRFGVSGIDYYEIVDGPREGEVVIISDMQPYEHLEQIDVDGDTP